MAEREKPTFTLLGRKIGIEEIAAMYRALTGREPTEEGLAEARAILERHGEPAPAGPDQPAAGQKAEGKRGK